MAGRADVAAALAEQRRKQMEHQTSAPGMPFGGIKERGNVLPFGQDEYGRNVFAQPQMFRDLVDAVTLPGDVVAGRREPNIPDVTNLAMALTVGASGGSAPAGALRSGAARSGKGFRAYHGSPHDFDRFDMSKVGTGEGAQAYGHGLYFADAEGVARSYRDDLSGGNVSAAKRTLHRFGGDVDAAINHRLENIERLKALPNGGGDPERQARQILINEDAVQQLRAFKEKGDWQGGHMYEVNINADPADFLDWDKPLGEQPRVAERLGMSTRGADDINKEAYDLMTEWVSKDGDARWMDDPQRRAIIDKLQNELDNIAPPVTGESFYRSGGQGGSADLAAMLGGRDMSAASAARLREAGIPGIKYLDAGSRGAGDGSRNYVVFDDSLIEILRKYGLAGAAVAGAATGMGGGEARADDALSAAMEDYIRRQQNGNR